VRRRHPEAAARTVQIVSFCRHAPLDEPLGEQLRAAIDEGTSDDFDVADPAGKEQADYDACAVELWELAQAFAAIVSDSLD
jgi:protein-tyrosine-phosphatase